MQYFFFNAKILWWTEWQISDKCRINIIFFLLLLVLIWLCMYHYCYFLHLKFWCFVYHGFFCMHWNTVGLDCWVWGSPFDFMPMASASSPCSTSSSTVWSLPSVPKDGRAKAFYLVLRFLRSALRRGGTCMYTAALITIGRRCKEPTWPSTDEWISEMSYIHTREHCVHAC